MYHKLLIAFTVCIASSDQVFGQGSFNVGNNRRCSPCVAYGKEYPPNTRFQHIDGCSEFNCDCNCDGSFFCPPERTRDICRQRDNCIECNAKGQIYKSNSPFKLREGCYEYNCFCKCDGGWNCPSEKTVDVCNTNTSTGCYYCNIDGRKIEGNSYFTHRNACIEYKSCICNCDGSWNCPGEYAIDHCRQNVSTGCYFCNVDGRKIEGNSRFDLVRDCYQYSGCICQCDGGWTCAHTTGKYLCDTERGKTRYSSTEVTSVQKITSSQESYEKSSEASKVSSGSCLLCYENNREYAANTDFQRDVGCNRFRCRCRCDGTVYCDPSNIENICTEGVHTGSSLSSSESGTIESRSSSTRYSSSFESERVSTGVGLGARGENIGTGLDTCFQCSDPAGKKHNAGSYFEYEVGCFRFGCNCRCNGSYDCPGSNTKYICRETGERRCNQCKAGNKIYYGGDSFNYTSGCYFYPTCKCECDGSWACSEDDAKYTCDYCRTCSIGGKSYQGNSNFELERGCEYFPKCFCNCSGSWSCSGEGVRDICGKCRRCNLNGTYYDGNTRFQYQDGCTLYRNCECNCDGSWKCRGGRYTCSRNDTAIAIKQPFCLVLDRRYSEGETFEFQRDCMSYKKCTCERDGNWYCKESVDTCGNCRSCIVNGTSYAGGKQFSLRTGCYNYKDCSCNCDGTWNCIGETAVDMCNNCKKCRVEGQDMNPFTRFPYERSCWKYQCFCNCDGSTECPPETAISTCSKPDICRKCNVNNDQVEGNTHFSYILDRVTMNCRCNCDGSYFCFGDLYYIRTDISISGSLTNGTDFGCVNCYLDGRTYLGNSTYTIRRAGMNMDCRCFCTGAYYCRGQTQFAADCQSCLVYGTQILGDRPFDLVYNGLKLSCTCACGGSYVCIGLQKEIVLSCNGTSGSGCLTSTCGRCLVDGSLIDGRTIFRTSYQGIPLTCLCGCDGSYFCEGGSGIVVTCVGGKCTELGACTSCTLFGRQYSGGSEFSLVYRGLKLNCNCRCGGDYQCLGSTGTAIISCSGGVGCLQSLCRSCSVDGRSIPGRNRFMTVYNGTDMQCDCGCDGSYYCEGVSVDIKISCLEGSCSQLGCRQCNIYGTLYNGNSQFDIVHNGLRMNCRCACDTSYQCFGTTGSLTVSCGTNRKGCLPSLCRPCIVDGGRYEGRTTFDYLYKGIEMKCQCGCDGNSFCTGVYEEIEISCVGGSCTPVGCGGCNIFGRKYTGSSKFDIIYQGLQLNCQCSCNGDYVCVGDTGIPVVSCKDRRGCLTDKCISCIVDGQVYAGRSTFTTAYNGLDVSCTCGCDGTYFCTGISEVISVSCIGGSCSPVKCGTCSIFDKNYPGRSQVDIVYNGVVINCKCSCDGSYNCYGSTGGQIITCIGGRGCLPKTCKPCSVQGREFMGGSQFQTVYNDIDMSCTCGCDGSYFCAGVSVDTKIICVNGSCRTDDCGTCSLFGRTFAGGSSFKIVYGGYEIQCTCECSGGYRCIGKTGTVVNCLNNVGCLLPPCNQCIVDGRSYPGQSMFSYLFNGIQMRCTCGCDGSYFCRGVTEVIEIACIGGRCTQVGCNTCSVDGRQISANSEFETYYSNIRMSCLCNCDGSYRCQGVEISITIECRGGTCLQIGCRSCIYQGREYQPKTQFETINNNRQERCQCECDGSVNCNEMVRPQCNNCMIDGIRYDGHTRFRHQRGQLSMICTCYCNGTHDCYSDHQVNVECKYCIIDGERYKGNTQFVISKSNKNLECKCNCDGTYRCSAKNVDVICRGSECGELTCTPCTIDGRQYSKNNRFEALIQGSKMQCSCDCDGSYRCEGERKICTSSSGCVDSCSSCFIAGGRFESNTQFETMIDNIRMQCTCNCDGSYRCEGNTRVCTRSGCVDTGCRLCDIEGRQYEGNTEFEAVVQGLRMKCRCNCDGGYVCTSEFRQCTGSGCIDIGCRRCEIEGRQYEGKTEFEAMVQGLRMKCRCNCDGGYVCTSESRQCTGSGCIDIGCRRCLIEGRQYEGKTEFEAIVQGLRMKCRCNCDGGYVCTSEFRQCTGSGCIDIGCRRCEIEGRQYDGKTEFEAMVQGLRMKCICNCDGGYVCTSESRQCTGSGCIDIGCRRCLIEGRQYEGKTEFEAIVQGLRMKCRCNCDGGYVCTSEFKQCTGSGCIDIGCRRCEIEGRQYEGKTEFEAIVQGLRMKCRCSCDGSYTCTTESRQCTGSGCIDIGCRRCEIEGRQYEGNTEFEAIVQGLRMKCRCSCDGSYTCTTESRQCTGSGCIDIGCRKCEIDGRQYEGNTEFEAIVQGLRMKCRCSCDGSYSCTTESRQCTGSGCTDIGCRRCTIDGRQYEGNTQFKTIINNIPVQCDCRCDGSYACRGEKETCVGPYCNEGYCAPCTIEGRNYSGNTRFEAMINGVRMQCTCLCGGSYKCQGEVRQTNCYGAGCREGGCNDCIIDGRRHQGNTRFETTYNGIPVQCNCSCDGSYSCKGERTTSSCEGTACTSATCNQCVIDRIPYAGNTRFEIMRDGIPMQCTCRCDGSYSCRGENTITTCIGTGCDTGGCGRCIADGHVYEGNSRFQMEIDGVDMNCICNCDGSYKCTGLKEVTACTGPSCDSRCRDCNVMGRTYRGNTQFTMHSGGIQLDCVCRCDGGYSCTGRQTISACDGGKCDQTCRSCSVDGRELQGNSRFQIVRDGVPLNCLCQCNGSYHCKGELAHCRGPGCQDGCRMCEIDGRPYTGNTRFRIQRGGRSLTCACYCNGSYECEGDTYTNACQGDGCADQACMNCFLDGVTYEGNSRFVLERAGFTMNCVCECDGAYRCQGTVTGNTCTGLECNNYGCRYCEIDGKQHPGNSQFTLEKGEITLSCECNCDGTYRCDGKTLAVACIGAQCGGGGCRTCEVDGKIFQGNTRFSINNDGLRMECVCNCDGSYRCRGYQVDRVADQITTCVECEIDGQRYAGNTRFDKVINGIRNTCACKCDGSYSCSESTIIPEERVQCRQCSVLGRQYNYLDKFELAYNGQAISCECLCDGGYECVKKSDGVVCTGNECSVRGCQDCSIFAVNYRGNTRFVTNAGGVTLECQCDCKGGYTCRGSYTTTSACSRCVLGHGDVYEGNSEFELTRGCFQIDCLCPCNGSWVCPTQRPRNVCGHQTLSGVFTPDSTSLSHSSRYDIAGSHVIADASSRVSDTILVSQSSQKTEIRTPGTGSCQSCTVNNKEYKGNTAFELLDKCLKFRCQCDCSGNWDCSSVETIKECISGDCVPCRVGSVSYKPNSQFEYRDGCNLYRCYCSCNGAYDCPVSDTDDLCSRVATPAASGITSSTSYTTEVKIRPSGSGSRLIEETQKKMASSKSTKISTSQTLSLSREISKGNSNSSSIQGRPSSIASSYDSNGHSERSSLGSPVHTADGSVSSSFSGTYQSSGSSTDSRSSSKYSSSLYSSSRSGNTSESGSYSSSSSSSSLLNALLASGGNCTNCHLGEMVVQGMKSFTFQSGCAEYLCDCNCDGSYTCPASRRSDICHQNGGVSGKKTRECRVKDHVYFTRRFTYIEGCLKFYCQCSNNGVFYCPASQTETVC
ncbi:hypothetical protein CHS0354_037192 [Potamilus streckersoni]|uniref:Uncharacterized protein n=1 Tax=Potamilus streckersoni TaxID=2493646 RepID=A0AAE0SXR0_9BIVA|nr:hypothetical protein CHS0354_037192 [Potamilus streckersoni]